MPQRTKKTGGAVNLRNHVMALSFFLALCAFVLALWVIFGAFLQGSILPFADTNWFLPIADSLKEGAPYHPFFEPPGGNSTKFNWHGWLTPHLYRIFWLRDGYEFAMASALPYIALSLILYLLALRSSLPRWTLLAILATYANLLFYYIGRPELVAQPFLLGIGFVFQSRASTISKGALSGLFAAALALISPVLAVQAGVIALIAIRSTTFGEAPFWRAASVAIVSSVSLAALATLLNPNIGLVEWITGMWSHISAISGVFRPEQLPYYYIYHRPIPLMLLAAVSLFAVLFAHAARRRDVVTWALVVILFLSFLQTSIKWPLQVYNFAALCPLAFLAATFIKPVPHSAVKTAKSLVAVFALANVAALAMRAAEYTRIEDGNRPDQLRESLRALPEGNRVFAFLPYAMLAREANMNVTASFHAVSYTIPEDSPPDYVVLPPFGVKPGHPPEGYCVMDTHAQATPIRLFGIPIASSSRGWDYVVLVSCPTSGAE